MAYVITDTCTKDELCVEACPTDCIHPKKDEEGFEAATQLYVDPDGCIDFLDHAHPGLVTRAIVNEDDFIV